jgi:hypothetical protein
MPIVARAAGRVLYFRIADALNIMKPAGILIHIEPSSGPG